MERLTARNERFPDETYYPYCFREDTCRGEGMSDKCDMCELPYKICKKLADYEDTGLTPDQIRELKERDTAKMCKQSIFDHDSITCACGSDMDKDDEFMFCPWCGQRLKKWEE